MKNKIYKIIDCDRHVIEPIEIWKHYLSSYLDGIPKIELSFDNEMKLSERVSQGFPALSLPPIYKIAGEPILSNWNIEQQVATALINSQSIKERKSATNPVDQLKSMDDTNVSQALIFPTFANYIVNHKDLDSRSSLAYAEAYNKWIRDYCAHNQKRLLPVGLISRHDTSTLVEQVQTIASFGWKSVVLRPEPILGKSLGHPDNDDFWKACSDLGIIVSFHGGTHLQGNTVGMDRFSTRFSLHACSHPMEAQMAFVSLLEAGVLERNPSLKLAFLEAGCSWVAHWLWRLDNICYNEFPSLTKESITMLPSEYFKRHCWVGVEIGEPLKDTLESIGHKKLIFGSDYPHPDHLHFDLTEIAQKLPELNNKQLTDILENNPKALFDL
ncbi:hypothetical protein PCIT_b0143 [Pseudoalteromonas citrea]|uniref:Amidohydrolase-related domain-containing protein n=2 Tax=Pseudoalteromonas citrea TaxID=43655 RepID=A0AAD4FPP2_9GAMM|nr:amidohydrolase family protein [Pseudoalteromonas citrea]KAF7764208.1 hypothetical protein PCIT_b0143 [Pseudoalteromonas citrea]